MKKTEADAVCHGEGDLTIVELVNHFLRPFDEWQNDLESITGISFLKTDNETGKNAVISTPPHPLVSDLNQLPFPDYSDFNFQEYSKDCWVPFYAQRGCYNQCNLL